MFWPPRRACACAPHAALVVTTWSLFLPRDCIDATTNWIHATPPKRMLLLVFVLFPTWHESNKLSNVIQIKLNVLLFGGSCEERGLA